MTRRWVLLPAWIVVLGALGAGLVAAGHGGLQPPPLRAGRDGLQQWTSTRDAATMLMAATRLLAIGLDAYLILTSIAGATARACRWTSAVRVTDRVTLPSVRRLLIAAVGTATLSMPIAAPALATTPPVAARLSSEPPLLRRLGTSVPTPPPATAPPKATAPTPPPPPSVPKPRPSVPAVESEQAPEVWIVRAGDNFWSIAARLTAPGDVALYWRELVAANRARLVTGDPSLIFPGQVLVIPPPPTR